ncbi:MAG: GAF domain-containing sensor histidine kinase, partial [Euryarchaeota archaeon]|nr:GAF domain-containing sensor histidine kinase [Euryarchaeota archaeon]
SLLQQINDSFIEKGTIGVILQGIVNGLVSSLGYLQSCIFLKVRGKPYLRLEAYAVEPEVSRKLGFLDKNALKGSIIPIAEGGLFEEMKKTRKPVMVTDIPGFMETLAKEKIPPGLMDSLSGIFGTESLIITPLFIRDRLIGYLSVGCRDVPREEEVEGIARFGEQAALALERARVMKSLALRKKELERSNMLKDLFIDIMHHDLLNPLSSVKMSAELLAEGRLEKPDEICQMLLKNIERAIELVENATEYARLEDVESLVAENLDFEEMLKDVIEEHEVSLKNKGIHLRYKADGRPIFRGNPILKMALSNLISNAIKYGPVGGEITVMLRECEGLTRIEVWDQGPGVPDELKSTIFERFKRQAKEGIKGSGMGLAIVKRIVELHHGRVWVEDNPNPGGGSIFVVELPKEGP